MSTYPHLHDSAADACILRMPAVRAMKLDRANRTLAIGEGAHNSE